ncbi:hypothetical protein BG005_009109 [Podila minutissima]|nr:hypothetical protein BG005_009109 [Podila minutissima]
MAVCLPTEFFKRDRPGLMPSSELKLLRLDFTADGDFPLASAEIMTNLIPISTIILPMAQIKYKVAMSFNDRVVATIDTPLAKVSADASALTTIMAPVPLVVEAIAQADFAAFVKAIVTSESVPIPLEGKADISFNIKPFLASQASVKVISGIGYQTTTVFPGLKGLPDIKFVSLIANTPDADKKTQTISFKVNINVASNLSVKLGDVEFNAAGPAGPIGTTTFKALTLAHGDNTIEAVTVIDLSLAGAADFVSGLSTADAALTLTGFADSTTNPLTVTAVEALKLTVVIPKQSTPTA